MIEFPNDLDVVIKRTLAAPRQLVYDVLTKPEHVAKTFAPFGETVTVCDIDLRVGGNYRFVMVTQDGVECAFRGTYLEVEPPTRTVATWRFEGWPDAEAIESNELLEADGGTTVIWKLAFRDKAGRARMTQYDGLEANFDNVEAYLRSLRSSS